MFSFATNLPGVPPPASFRRQRIQPARERPIRSPGGSAPGLIPAYNCALRIPAVDQISRGFRPRPHSGTLTLALTGPGWGISRGFRPRPHSGERLMRHRGSDDAPSGGNQPPLHSGGGVGDHFPDPAQCLARLRGGPSFRRNRGRPAWLRPNSHRPPSRRALIPATATGCPARGLREPSPAFVAGPHSGYQDAIEDPDWQPAIARLRGGPSFRRLSRGGGLSAGFGHRPPSRRALIPAIRRPGAWGWRASPSPAFVAGPHSGDQHRQDRLLARTAIARLRGGPSFRPSRA